MNAIEVENIAKCYRIGMNEEKNAHFASALFGFVKNPLANYRKYRSLYNFDDLKPDSDQIPTDILWALRDVSFSVAQGETVGIIGRNGAGKSTLLKVLSNITCPSHGWAKINGRVSSLLEVGTGFHPQLTGRENIYLNGTVLGMTKNEVKRKFDEIVAFSGVEKFLDTPVKRYSSGMSVRLAFSVAAHLEPEILIVDEVLAVGDASFQKKCLNKMEDVSGEGRTVLFVSHNMAAIMRLCPRAILLDQGRIIEDGPAPTVVKAYLNADTGTAAVQEWMDASEAPQGNVARLLGVRIRNADGVISETIDIRHPVGIEMEYDLIDPGHVVMPYYHLRNDDGVLIFCAHDTDPEWLNRPRSAGRYKSTAWIPGNLLSEGTIMVSPGLLTLDPNIPQFSERDVVAFQVIERNGNGAARGGWAGSMTGVVRPLLDWNTQVELVE